MTATVETELKLGLGCPDDVERLLAALPAPASDVVQENHYFADAAGLLAAAAVMLRVRAVRPVDALRPDIYIVTAKRRRGAEHGVFIADELEQTLTPTEADAVFSARRDLLTFPGPAISWVRAEIGPESVQRLGAMVNRRRTIAYEGFLLEVDQTTFLDGSIDVEIEIETEHPEAARVVVSALCERAGVGIFDQQLGKFSRFLQRSEG